MLLYIIINKLLTDKGTRIEKYVYNKDLFLIHEMSQVNQLSNGTDLFKNFSSHFFHRVVVCVEEGAHSITF